MTGESPASPAGPVPLDWRVEHADPRAPGLVPAESGGLPVDFGPGGISTMSAAFPFADEPFTCIVDAELTAGLMRTFRRVGVEIALTTAMPSDMGDDDWAIVMAATEQGAIATVWRGGTLWARHDERRGRRRVMAGRVAEGRFDATMGNAGGHRYSVRWPAPLLEGQHVRFKAVRTPGNAIELSLFHAASPRDPWWTTRIDLPPALASKPLRWIVMHSSRDDRHYADPAAPLEGTDRIAGRVRRVAVWPGALDAVEPAFAEVVETEPATRGATPAVFFDAASLAAAREKFDDPRFADYRIVLEREADRHAAAIEDRERGLTLKTVGSAVGILGFVSLVGETDRYGSALDRAIAIMTGASDRWMAREEGSPGRLRQGLSVHEFDAQHHVGSMLVYSSMPERLDVAQRQRIESDLRRIMRVYLRQVERNDWWYANNPSNTVGVAAGVAGLAALTMREAEPELARRTLDTAIEAIVDDFAAITDEGASLEGPMYWNYGTSWPLLLAWCLEQTRGGDGGIHEALELREADAYVKLVLTPDGRMLTFNDTQPWLCGWVPSAASTRLTGDPLMLWLSDHMAEQYVGRAIDEESRAWFAATAWLYRDASQSAPAAPPAIPTLHVLESINEAAMRSEPRVDASLFTGVKGVGDRLTHHANEDQGGFVLYAEGEMMLIDPGYFEPRSDQHSVVVPASDEPNPMRRPRLDPRQPAPITAAWEDGDLRSVTIDATAAYTRGRNRADPLAERVRRVFVQASDEALIVLDDYVPVGGSGEATSHFQMASDPRIGPPGASFSLERRGVTLTGHVLGPEATIDTRSHRFRRQWVFADYLDAAGWTTLSVTATRDPKDPLITVLAADRASGSGDGSPRLEKLGDGGRVVVLPSGRRVVFEPTRQGWSVRR